MINLYHKSFEGKENAMRNIFKEQFFFAIEKVLVIIDIIILDLLGEIIVMDAN